MVGQKVAVLGAGPYGLAIGAHLHAADITTRVFGETMGFWRGQMPVGMLLRSEWAGSSIASPGGACSLERYEAAKQVVLSRRIPLDDFIAYGGWFQQQALPDVDGRLVGRVSSSSGGFRLELEDGDELQAERVIIATGLASFARQPRVFASIPPEFALHSSKVRDVASFADKQIAIVGAGQSALELAALLGEAGARVEVIARGQEVRWLSGHGYLRRYGGPFRKLIYPPGEVGPLGINWIVEYPNLFRKLPIEYQRRIYHRALRPAGSAWLRPRITNVMLTPGREVIAATASSNGVTLTLDDATTREVDRVVMATGYEVDVDRYPLLDPALAASVKRHNGAPILVEGFESSVPGLHFAGAAAADSFGPLLRFVAGTGFTARAIANCVQETKKNCQVVRASVEAAADLQRAAQAVGKEPSMSDGRQSGSPKNGAAQTGAIVIGANYGGLGIVRSLGRHGIPIVVLQDEHASAAASKFAQVRLPWPESDEKRQLRCLLDLCDSHGVRGWTIFPTTDKTAALLSRHAETLYQRYCLTTPSWPVMQWAYDKRLTYKLASDLGIDHPYTFQPRNEDEAAALDCAFPVVLKPAIKDRMNQFTADRAWPAQNHEELLARYREACRLVDPELILIQELIPGGGESQYSFAALCDHGHPLAFGVARRKRQYPVDFGHGSTYVETVDEPEVEDSARRLLAHIDYTGLVEIEFKRHPATGRFKLLDINARAWAWHSLGHRAGVDFPYLCWRMVHDDAVPDTRARSGVHWVRMATDVPSALTEMRRGRLSPRAYIASLRRPLEFAVFSLDDPVPALIEAPSMLSRIWNRTVKVRQQNNGT